MIIHNRAQAYLRRRFRCNFILHTIAILAVVFVAVFSLPKYASAAVIVNETFSSADYNGALIVNSSGASTTRAVKWTATGAYNQSVNSVSLRLGREAIAAGSCSIAMDVYVSGANPYPDGIFLRRSTFQDFNTLSTSVSGKGGGLKAFDFSADPFVMFPGFVYYFEPFKTGTNCNKTMYMFIHTMIESQLHRVMYYQDPNWNVEDKLTSFVIDADQGDYNPPAWDGTSNLKMYNSYPTESAMVKVGSGAEFHFTWTGATTVPRNVYFQEDVNDSYVHAVTVAEDETGDLLQENDNVIFFHRYKYAGTYLSSVIITDCPKSTFLTDENCNTVSSNKVVTVTASGLVSGNKSYNNSFVLNKYNDVIVGRAAAYSYSLDTTMCAGSITSRRLYKGFSPGNFSSESGGTLLSLDASSGSIVFQRTNQPYSDFFFPYITVQCSDSTSKIVYLGGSTLKSGAIGVSVYTADDIRYWEPAQWLNGGESPGFGSGTGYAFFTDKKVYEIAEPVKMRFVHNTTFTPSKVIIYRDDAELYDYFTLTGSYLTSNKTHRYQISYGTPGSKNPMIQVRSATYSSGDPTTYRNIYLHGGQEIIPGEEIYVNEGGIFSGISDCSERGVFGMAIADFSVIEAFKNPNLFSALFGVSWALAGKTLTLVAGNAFCLLEHAPLFTQIHDVIVPIEGGTTKLLPSTYFGSTYDMSSVDREFVIAYASPNSDFAIFDQMIRWIVGVGIFVYVFTKLF